MEKDSALASAQLSHPDTPLADLSGGTFGAHRGARRAFRQNCQAIESLSGIKADVSAMLMGTVSSQLPVVRSWWGFAKVHHQGRRILLRAGHCAVCPRKRMPRQCQIF